MERDARLARFKSQKEIRDDLVSLTPKAKEGEREQDFFMDEMDWCAQNESDDIMDSLGSYVFEDGGWVWKEY